MANYLQFGHQTTGIGQGLLHNDESQSLPSGGSPVIYGVDTIKEHMTCVQLFIISGKLYIYKQRVFFS